MNKAVFLDRDGTINIDTGYIGDPESVKLYPGVAEGIKKLKDDLGFYVIVISNQSGITRGLISQDDVEEVNKKINEILSAHNIQIDAFYYCPYHPEFDLPEKCKCRKPSPSMVNDASKDFKIDLKRSFLIGDRATDIECAFRAGLKSILIKNTISDAELNELKNSHFSPNFVTENFTGATGYIEKYTLGEIIEK